MTTEEPKAFEKYTTAELLAELERRDGGVAETPRSAEVQFTHAGGWLGWLQAKLIGSPLYGAGSIEVNDTGLVLCGCERTWLGTSTHAEIVVPFSQLRGVLVEKSRLSFEMKRSWWRRQLVDVKIASDAQGSEIRRLLSSHVPSLADSQWAAIRTFYRSLRLLTPRVWVTPALIALNLIPYVGLALHEHRLGAFDSSLLVAWGANYGPLTTNGQWWRLIAATFLHLSLAHVLLNMWALWGAGRFTERLYGNWHFAIIYLTAGLIGSFGSLAWQPATVSVGASGAIFGVLGAFLAMLRRRGSELPSGTLRAHWISTLAFVGFNLIAGAVQPQIDNAAHVAGLIGGFLLGCVLARPLSVEKRNQLRHQRAAVASAIAATVIALGFWQTTQARVKLTQAEEFIKQHPWYAQSETRNLALWNELATQLRLGAISASEFASRFEKEVLPFWRSVNERFAKAGLFGTTATRHSPEALIAKFARLRLEWARSLVEMGRGPNVNALRKSLQLERRTARIQAQILRLNLRAQAERRSLGLANRPAVVRLKNWFQFGSWRCVEEPARVQNRVAPTDSRSDGPAARRDLGCQAQELFVAGDFRALDALMTRHMSSLHDLPDGSARFAGLTNGLADLFPIPRVSWAQALERTAAWRRVAPHSVHAELIEAMLFDHWAWEARGRGYAASVSAIDWALFRLRVDMADAALGELATLAKENPLWYDLSMQVALDESASLEEQRSIFDAGIARLGDYWPLHRNMLRTLMPRWGGSYGKVDFFINEMYGNAAQTNSYEVYARLYWMYSLLEQDSVDIFKDAQAIWADMQRGFKEMLERYPSSDYLLNGYANFACRAGDAETYGSLRPAVAKRFSASAWTNKFSLETCDTRVGRGR